MGVLPLVFPGAGALGLTGTERFRLQLPEARRAPQKGSFRGSLKHSCKGAFLGFYRAYGFAKTFI